MRGVGGFAGAPIVTAIRTTTTMACTPTLRHKPLVERPRGRVFNRASANRIDMCRTELTCRSVLLQRRCCLGSSCSKRSAATIVEPGQIGRARAANLRFWTPLAKLRDRPGRTTADLSGESGSICRWPRCCARSTRPRASIAMSDPSVPVSRRRFCAGVCQVASGAAFVTMFSACGDGSSPTGPSGMASPLGTVPGRLAGSTVQVTVAGSALADVGGAALVESNAGVFLLSRPGGMRSQPSRPCARTKGAWSTEPRATPTSARVTGRATTGTGQVVNGPARANLRRYSSSFANGVVTIAL